MTAPSLDAHRADFDYLITAALEALAGAWVDGDPNEIRDALAAALPDLAATYGGAAATLGADWYDEMREAADVSGRFRAIAADLPDQGRLDSLVGWGTQPLFEPADFVSLDEFVPDLDAAKARVGGGFQRIVGDADRDSVMGSLRRDPKAAGWRRQTTGASCKFCIGIAARGAVFSARTANFASHDNCDCICIPVIGNDFRNVLPYTPAQRFRTQGQRDANNARIREWLATAD